MTQTILHIDSSPMGDRSVTRKLTQKLVSELVAKRPNSTVIYHDFSAEIVPNLDGPTLGAFFTPEPQRTPDQAKLVKRSDELTEELLNADIIVVGAPMWNFNIPSSLKAWIDHVSRVGKTFIYTESGSKGLVSPDKKVIVVSSSGGIYSQGPGQTFDFQTPYLKTFFGFLGITDVSIVRAEGTSMGPDAAAKAIQQADVDISQVVGALQ